MSPEERQAFLERLALYRDLTLETLRRWLQPREPRRHLYDLVQEHLSRSGKGLRPALCLATCGAFGGRIEDALQSAAAIEMLHNAFLVHDDVEDESEFRRDRRTLRARYGVPLAVNTGDAMQAMSLRMLRDNLDSLGARVALRVFDEFDRMLIQSLEGQAMELGWIWDNDCEVTVRDYLRMTLKKTCWYSFIHPCRIGALIAGPAGLDLDRFNAFGFFLGAAFQIQDDLLNLVGEKRKYGKEIWGDLYEGKRTLPLLQALHLSDGHERHRLERFLSKPRARRLPRDVHWVHDLLTKYGSIEFGRSAARELAGAAAEAFESAYGDVRESEHKSFVRHAVGFVTEREF